MSRQPQDAGARAQDDAAPATIAPPGFTLARDRFGRLLVRLPDGTTHVGAVAVRAFPISAPGESVSLLDSEGHELVWIARLADLPEATRVVLEEELARREFMPEIRAITSVSGFVTPCTWEVATDRGPTRFVLPGEEAIRRLSPSTLLIADSHGIHYLLRDIAALDRNSRKLLDRFL
ncbi:MAG: DUF1854 domain-containing protein [Burkholderiaceae bacterium]|nr:DUF1854 domain-containing protein [Burkholderiaceae bacterium]